MLDFEDVESSYSLNGYGYLFYSIVRLYKPSLIVELGSFSGYSGLHMAAALRDNNEVKSRLVLIDLWENYTYRHCSKQHIMDNFERNELVSGINHSIDFIDGDAFEVSSQFPDNTIDLLHVDLSNDGDLMFKILPVWEKKLTNNPNAIILMEGGSASRDEIEWMKKYKKSPLRDWLASQWVTERFSSFTFDPFPSLTILRRVI